ncbi:MAG TPA: polyprenyl synthetase family protein [Myxococcota bacterium]|nr:polyprenyl synthetase family protein [Myxococcota bacterium]
MKVSGFELSQLKEQFELALIGAVNRPRSDGDFYSKRLQESINYAVFSSGKRLRPLLVLATALSYEAKKPAVDLLKLAMPAALAVELIHTYSLVHDDLPAMDDDDYRRGRFSVHRRFDEALAILTGDALLTDAFWFASSIKNNAAEICRELARMAGSRGLVAGQAEDLSEEAGLKNLDRWLSINQAKTARLFATCASIGLLAVDAPPQPTEQAAAFGQAFGLAFQIQDDLTDEQGCAKATNSATLLKLLEQNISLARASAESLQNPRLLLDLITNTLFNS